MTYIILDTVMSEGEKSDSSQNCRWTFWLRVLDFFLKLAKDKILNKTNKFTTNIFWDFWNKYILKKIYQVNLQKKYFLLTQLTKFFSSSLFRTYPKIGSFRLSTHSRDAHKKFFWLSLFKIELKFRSKGR